MATGAGGGQRGRWLDGHGVSLPGMKTAWNWVAMMIAPQRKYSNSTTLHTSKKSKWCVFYIT